MFILNRLVYIFVIGTVTCGMAPAQTESVNDLRVFLPVIVESIRFLTTEPLTFKNESVRLGVRDKCERNGGPFAFANATAALQDVRKGVQSTINETLGDLRLHALRPINDRDEFAKACEIIRAMNTMIAPSLESVKPCLDREEQQRLAILANIQISMANYICENNGTRFFSFWRDDGIECYKNKSEAITSCKPVPRSVPVNVPSVYDTVVDRISIPWRVPSNIVMNTEQCRDADSIFTCILQHMQSCDRPMSYKVFSDTYNYFKEISGCTNLLNANTSAAVEVNGVSSAGGDNVKRNSTSN